MDRDDITDIKVAIAHTEEQIKSLSGLMSMQHKSIADKIEGLASQSMVDVMSKRLEKIESNQSWVIKGIIGTIATAIAAAIGIGRKIGL